MIKTFFVKFKTVCYKLLNWFFFPNVQFCHFSWNFQGFPRKFSGKTLLLGIKKSRFPTFGDSPIELAFHWFSRFQLPNLLLPTPLRPASKIIWQQTRIIKCIHLFVTFCVRSDWILDLLKQNQRKLYVKTIVTNVIYKAPEHEYKVKL